MKRLSKAYAVVGRRLNDRCARGGPRGAEHAPVEEDRLTDVATLWRKHRHSAQRAVKRDDSVAVGEEHDSNCSRFARTISLCAECLYMSSAAVKNDRWSLLASRD